MTPRPHVNALRAFAFGAACGLLLGVAAARAQSDIGGSGRSSGNEFPNLEAPQRARPITLYFPPSPPPLGQPIPAVIAGSPRNSAPAGLADFVSDVFYPPLGVRLATRTLSEKQRARLDRYRAEKLALQQELRTELERLRDAEPGARERDLAALARRQAPRLAALEQTAEELRRDFTQGDETWSALRDWRISDRVERGFSPAEIAQVMRGYAFYSPHVPPAQRRLLREIHLELAAATDNKAYATVAQPYLFFSPEPARVRLPDDLPAEVAAKIAVWQTKKSRLKKELYDAVFAEEGQKFSFLRTSPLKTLAAAQQPALAELETLAEDIRLSLAHVVPPAAIAERTPLPPTLQARVAALVAANSALQRSSSSRLAEIFAAHRDVPMLTSFRFEADGLRVVVIPPPPGRGSPGPSAKQSDSLARIAAVRAQAATVVEDHGRQLAEIVNETNALRAEIARTVGATHASAIDAAFLAATRVAAARDTAGLYSDYRVAVFQPGLSPEQRRLLFDAAVAALSLPLPRGEQQPTGRSARW